MPWFAPLRQGFDLLIDLQAQMKQLVLTEGQYHPSYLLEDS
jgi:hypothetical protein